MPEQLFVNAKVFTGCGEQDYASAFRIADGTFTWTGDAAEVRGEAAVDLGGRVVLPGLLDQHTHPSGTVWLGDAVDCLPPAVTSLAQLVERLRSHPLAGQGGNAWITGTGYDDGQFPEGRPPTRHDLDLVSATQPVIARRCDGHSAACNTRALELAGITAQTPDPPGGRFERDADGQPNGGLTEIAAVMAVMSVLPPASHEDNVRRLAGLNEHMLSRGITGLCDLWSTKLPRPLEVFREAAARGFQPRCNLYYGWEPGQPLADLSDDDRAGRVRVGGVKVFMDGAYSNRTAWVAEPYPCSDDHGMATLTDADARAAAAWARRNQVQLAVHAMGDQALERVLDLFGDEEPWLDGQPSIRLEHATLMSPGLIERVNRARMSFAVVTHTIFLFAEHESYRRNLHQRQADLAYPVRALYEAGGPLALSSDWPSTAWSDADDVFVSVQAAVLRQAANGRDIGQAAAVTVPQALLLYTGRARQVADLGPVGLIAPGFEGSFVVLDRDVFTVPAEEISSVRVAETWLAGVRAY